MVRLALAAAVIALAMGGGWWLGRMYGHADALEWMLKRGCPACRLHASEMQRVYGRKAAR